MDMPKKPPQTPLFVRLPSDASKKLDRAAEVLGLHKKDLVASLVEQYVDPDAMLASRGSRYSAGPLQVGSYSFRPYDPPEIMSSEQAAQFLQIDEKNVIELAEAGKLPGKKLGPVWRFARDALVTWLSTPDKPEPDQGRKR